MNITTLNHLGGYVLAKAMQDCLQKEGLERLQVLAKVMKSGKFDGDEMWEDLDLSNETIAKITVKNFVEETLFRETYEGVHDTLCVYAPNLMVVNDLMRHCNEINDKEAHRLYMSAYQRILNRIKKLDSLVADCLRELCIIYRTEHHSYPLIKPSAVLQDWRATWSEEDFENMKSCLKVL